MMTMMMKMMMMTHLCAVDNKWFSWTSLFQNVIISTVSRLYVNTFQLANTSHPHLSHTLTYATEKTLSVYISPLRDTHIHHSHTDAVNSHLTSRTHSRMPLKHAVSSHLTSKRHSRTPLTHSRCQFTPHLSDTLMYTTQTHCQFTSHSSVQFVTLLKQNVLRG